jgi:hypothetical protein
MIRRLATRAYRTFKKAMDERNLLLEDQRLVREFWSRVPELELVWRLDVAAYSPDVIRIADVDGDGVDELVLFSTCGMYKSALYSRYQVDIRQYLASLSTRPFQVTVVRPTGEVVWRAGEPYPSGARPYISHAPELMMDVLPRTGMRPAMMALLTNDAHVEIRTAHDGAIVARLPLPTDNYSNIKFVHEKPDGGGELLMLVGVTDRSYDDPRTYANPWLLMRLDGTIIWKQDVLGAGHSFLVHDFDGDGTNELMIGYEFLRLDGSRGWMVEGIDPAMHDPIEEHVDTCILVDLPGTKAIAIAASTYQYLADFDGRVLWRRRLPHPQSVLLGLHEGTPVLTVINQRDPIATFTLDGSLVAKNQLPEYWPTKRPPVARREVPIHTDIPAVPVYRHAGASLPEYFAYFEGGVPYLCDFIGRVAYRMPPQDIFRGMVGDGFRRINDLGLSFEAADPTSPQALDSGVRVFRRDEVAVYRRPGNGKP